MIVITGDIISSSQIPVARRSALLKSLEEANLSAKKLLPGYEPEIFQGDSFQGNSANEKFGLKASLLIMMQLLSRKFGVRISIGIGQLSFNSGSSLTSDGTAFQLSGRNMDLLKKDDQLLSIACEDPTTHAEWQVHGATLNYLLKKCSALQAAAILEMLLDHTQQEAAKNLQVKQPAIQQRLQAAGWPLLQTIIQRFESQF